MLSVHLEAGQVGVRDVPVPARPPGFALLKLLRAGICNTDLELQRGYYGFVGTPGHEFVAEVVDADDSQWSGQRVVGEINLNCRRCEWCARGLGRHCPQRTVLGILGHPGAFQEYFTLPVHNLHTVPASVSTEDAVFVEPLAAAAEILDQVQIPADAPVAVLGDGKLGLLIALVLQSHGAQVKLYGRHASKLQLAEKAGVKTAVVNGQPLTAAYPFVVDATGSAEGLQQAVRLTLPRGTLVLKSTVQGTVPIDTAPIIVNELTLVGSRCGRFAPALSMLARKRLDLSGFVSDRIPLAEAARAFELAGQRGVLKVQLTP